jgi:cysteine desulfurase / selenocysteine lyase
MLSPEPSWEAFRQQMPAARQWAYFDHAAVAPLSGPGQAVLAEWATDAAVNGGVNWNAWRKRLEQVRRTAARLVNADLSEIALIRNTTEGVNLVAEGFPWQPGDNVVTPTGEFPTNLYPWLNLADRGVEVRRVDVQNERLDLARLDAACDSRTRIVAVSWVGYATGYRNDVDALAEIAHRHGALLFLDAIQALGVFPLDVKRTPVDFFAADGHKWLLGPEGAGLFYIRSNHLDLLRPLGIGWNSVAHAGDFARPDLVLKRSAGRYEGGTYNMGGLAALGASLDLLTEHGVPSIAKRLLDVTNELCERLPSLGIIVASDRDPERASGIVSCEVPSRDPGEIKRRCLERNVIVNCRAGRLRISPHVYTNAEDLDRLLEALGEAG